MKLSNLQRGRCLCLYIDHARAAMAIQNGAETVFDIISFLRAVLKKNFAATRYARDHGITLSTYRQKNLPEGSPTKSLSETEKRAYYTRKFETSKQ